ncbi:hypothetical protein ANN_12153 [Periplaneta americana]|uniref:Uncharacterized protein n=1 Tax=Periplaneta americana TaxID=6978 RepID=A0ABQ8T707_PERAM|nr:hypothetical protein ANN_12153 [Periplaneta americana]
MERKNSLRRRDLNPGFQLYVLMLYPLSHTGYNSDAGQNRLRLSSNSWVPSGGRPLHYVIDVYERRTEVHTCAEHEKTSEKTDNQPKQESKPRPSAAAEQHFAWSAASRALIILAVPIISRAPKFDNQPHEELALGRLLTGSSVTRPTSRKRKTKLTERMRLELRQPAIKATVTLPPPHATFSPTPTLANQNAKPHCQAEVEVQSIPKRLKLLSLYELKRSRKTLLSYETVLVLRKIFGAKRDEVTGEWRKLHNTELHALYSSPDIIRNIKSRRLRWAGHVAHMGESRNTYSVLVGRPERKKSLGRPRRRWEDNIKMDLREVGYDGRDWIGLAQDRDQWRAYVRAAMNLQVP